jgi:hypothetical protein
MTLQEHENHFIERCRKEFGALTFDAEMLLRYAYTAGANELGTLRFHQGVDAQRDTVLEALGACARKETFLP